ncbi:MAG: fibronectin type III domain-containing protein, partial [Thaumarchaeota archaeon]
CTQSWDVNIPSAVTGASSSTVQTTAGSITCSWTASGGDFWDDVAIEVKSSITSNTATAPGSPTGLTATAASSSQINLSWNAPANNGGSAITGYKIERSTDSGSTWFTLVANTGSTSTTYSDSGLIPTTTYTYRVSAINSAGTSSPSNITSATTPGSIRSINQVNSGLAASDPLNNETKTQQQLQSNPRYWTYGGDAPLQTPPAPYDFYKDSQGLHIGVKSTGNDTTTGQPKWAGFYALAPGTNAALFHAVISTPVRTIPSFADFYENSLYVQTSVNAPNALVNYVACGANTSGWNTLWAVYSATGDGNSATTFTRLYLDNNTDQSLTRDCTIITNGSNYLKVYLDGVMVYTNNKLNLQMQEPFNAFLEPQSSYAGQLLEGIYKDYYVTTDENIQVTNLPSNAARVDLTDTSGKVLASAPVNSGTATMVIGQFHMPLSAYIKIYDSLGNQLASTSSPVNIFGGDVYTVRSTIG